LGAPWSLSSGVLVSDQQFWSGLNFDTSKEKDVTDTKAIVESKQLNTDDGQGQGTDDWQKKRTC